MVCITLFGVQIRVDFTAPALGALLCLMMPLPSVLQMLFACILHESAHFLAFWYYGCRPQTLRISALGMDLCGEHLAVYPGRQQAVMLLSGVTANLAAGALCMQMGMTDVAMWQIATAVCNLLPYRSTDGGTLLYLLLDSALGAEQGHWLRMVWRLWIVAITAFFALLMLHLPQCPAGMWAMLLFFFAAEWLR